MSVSDELLPQYTNASFRKFDILKWQFLKKMKVTGDFAAQSLKDVTSESEVETVYQKIKTD